MKKVNIQENVGISVGNQERPVYAVKYGDNGERDEVKVAELHGSTGELFHVIVQDGSIGPVPMEHTIYQGSYEHCYGFIDAMVKFDLLTPWKELVDW